jgi:hypothetical protein
LSDSLEGYTWLYRGVPVESPEAADVDFFEEIRPTRPDQVEELWRQWHSAGMTDTGSTNWSTERWIAEAAAQACSEDQELNGQIRIFRVRIDSRQQSWLRAIAGAAKEQNLTLPSFTGHAMGGARTESAVDGRFVTFKRRLVHQDQAQVDGIEWALWLGQDGLPERIAAFREPLEPKRENVANVLTLIKGWLLDRWAPAEAKAAVGMHPRVQIVEDLPAGGGQKR